MFRRKLLVSGRVTQILLSIIPSWESLPGRMAQDTFFFCKWNRLIIMGKLRVPPRYSRPHYGRLAGVESSLQVRRSFFWGKIGGIEGVGGWVSGPLHFSRSPVLFLVALSGKFQGNYLPGN